MNYQITYCSDLQNLNWFDGTCFATGTCSYCRSEGQQLLKPERIRDNFELLLSVYTVDDGQILADWCKSDWPRIAARQVRQMCAVPTGASARNTQLIAGID
jgi:hypothetical protein